MSVKEKTISDTMVSVLIILTLLAMGILLPKWQFFKEVVVPLDPDLIIIVLFIAIGFINIWRLICDESTSVRRRYAKGVGWGLLFFILCLVVMTMVFQQIGLPT